MNKKLNTILEFLHKSEKLKTILRHSWLSSGRRESVAEHTWRMALMAIVLCDEIDLKLDKEKVLTMIIIHDLCEVYAGDYPSWKKKNINKHKLEKIALDKITKSLSSLSRKRITMLWEEFEDQKTNESKFAQAMDKLEVLLQHNEADINTWRKGEDEFNLNYAIDKFTFNTTLKQLREMVRKDTQKKIINSQITRVAATLVVA